MTPEARTRRTVEDSEATRIAVGRRIAEARAASPFAGNASAFARAVGVQPNTVYRWEDGAVVPDIFRLESIARVCRVSSDWLLRGAEDVTAHEALDQWLAGPRGQLAAPGAVRFLRSLPLAGYRPSPQFWDLALIAYESGLSPDDAATAARASDPRGSGER